MMKWIKVALNAYSVIGLLIVVFVTIIAVKIHKKKNNNPSKKGRKISPAKKINEFVIEMLKDDDIVEFCQKFCLEKSIPGINDLSFSFLPIQYNSSSFEYKLNYIPVKNTTSLYLKTLNTYTKDYIKNSQSDVARAYLCTKKEFDGHYKIGGEKGRNYRLEACISRPYKKLWDSFYTLQEKGLLKKRDNEQYFQAFCFVIYYEALKIFSEENINDLKEFGLSSNDSNSKIIKTLYDKNLRKDDILTILCMNNVTKQNCCTAVKWKDPEMKALIEREIEKQKSTNLVDKYLPDIKKKTDKK